MNAFKEVKVRTWYLVYNGSVSIKNEADMETRVWKNPDLDEYLSMYKKIGEPWGWAGRLTISLDELKEILNQQQTKLFKVVSKKQVIGYFELEINEKDSEIVYLGLLPEYIGKGLGKGLMKAAIKKALEFNEKVWLHTCEYDHPNALTVYQKAGFVIEREEVEKEKYSVDFLKNH